MSKVTVNSGNAMALLDGLCESFGRQRESYARLVQLMHRSMSQLVLSRGDLSGVSGAFDEKKRLLESIEQERQRAQPLVCSWSEHKEALRTDPRAADLDAVLGEVQSLVREFLAGEEQLAARIEHALTNRTQQ